MLRSTDEVIHVLLGGRGPKPVRTSNVGESCDGLTVQAIEPHLNFLEIVAIPFGCPAGYIAFRPMQTGRIPVIQLIKHAPDNFSLGRRNAGRSTASFRGAAWKA